jgi:hypothetical protein
MKKIKKLLLANIFALFAFAAPAKLPDAFKVTTETTQYDVAFAQLSTYVTRILITEGETTPHPALFLNQRDPGLLMIIDALQSDDTAFTDHNVSSFVTLASTLRASRIRIDRAVVSHLVVLYEELLKSEDYAAAQVIHKALKLIEDKIDGSICSKRSPMPILSASKEISEENRAKIKSLLNSILVRNPDSIIIGYSGPNCDLKLAIETMLKNGHDVHYIIDQGMIYAMPLGQSLNTQRPWYLSSGHPNAFKTAYKAHPESEYAKLVNGERVDANSHTLSSIMIVAPTEQDIRIAVLFANFMGINVANLNIVTRSFAETGVDDGSRLAGFSNDKIQELSSETLVAIKQIMENQGIDAKEVSSGDKNKIFELLVRELIKKEGE